MINERVESYLKSLIPPRGKAIEEIELYAEKEQIPIMDLVGMESLLQQLKLIKPERILEIGTAIGYSAIRMAQSLPNVTITTIERDRDRYEEAIANIKKLELTDRIEVKFGDALEIVKDLEKDEQYDVLFIDAAKAQYERFFTLYGQFIKRGGVIFSDNVLFRGLVANDEIENKRLQKIAKKVATYNKWVMEQSDYDSRILPVGDGICISIKNNEV